MQGYFPGVDTELPLLKGPFQRAVQRDWVRLSY